MKTSARLFIALVVVAGLAVLGKAALHPSLSETPRFLSFLAVACLAARLKVKLPGFTGNMSVNLPFILVATAEMGLLEALIVACLSTLTQCLPSGQKKFNFVRAAFNVSAMALSVETARLLYDTLLPASIGSRAVVVAIAAAGYLLANTVPVAIIISLTESKSAVSTWAGIFQLSFPYFVASAGIAAVVTTLSARIGWELPLAVLPVMLGIFHSYRRYFAANVPAVETEHEPVHRGAAAVQAS